MLSRPRAAASMVDVQVRFPVRGGRRGSVLRAVDGVDLELFAGEALGLVGESGSGKSTLAKVLIGLQRPTSGAVLLDDKEVPAVRDRALTRKIQLVFQDPALSLNPRMTVGAMLREVLGVHRIVPKNRIAERAAELLATVELPASVADMYPRRLSGGQRQRVAIARALAVEPRLLVADEPVAALDVSVQAAILALLDRLRSELDLGLLFISHDLAVISHLCDRVAVMYLGRIVEVAPTAELFEQPRHPYTQVLIDSVPRAHAPWRRELPMLDGDPPSPIDLPAGCRFQPRCPRAFAACATEPRLAPATTNNRSVHAVACQLSAEPTQQGAI
jgi:oligopeptide/dipeptide ABC transporter ATP-binding protein